MIVHRKGCILWLQVVVLICIVAGMGYVQARLLTHFEKNIELPPETKTAILERIHLAGELTTAIGCIQTVVKSGEVREWVQVQVGSVEILYVAVGNVRAGINLMELNEKALMIDGTKATLVLPSCRILDASIDVKRSYVFDIKRSVVLSPQAIHLQTSAERKALEEIQATAIQAGILQQAQKQAEVLIRYFLEASGIREVKFMVKGDAKNE